MQTKPFSERNWFILVISVLKYYYCSQEANIISLMSYKQGYQKKYFELIGTQWGEDKA